MRPKRNGRPGDVPSAAVCDVCVATLYVDPRHSAYPHLVAAPDSSAVDPLQPGLDGLRVAVACSPECRHTLEEIFARRPFTPEELWAGKLKRALRAHPGGLRPLELLLEAGLTEAQMRAGFRWLDEQRRGTSAPPREAGGAAE
jgi:hypothetical protein